MIRSHVRPIIGRDIPIGRKGENLARAVDFSDIIAEIKKDYGDGGKIVVLVKRPNEDVPYPAAAVDESDGLTWTPTETDTAIVGRGNAEVDYYVDDVLVKSVLFTTYTHDSIGVSGDTPEPGYDYMKQLLDALEKVGTGIVSVDMNKDSSITFHMSDGTEYTTEPLKGADGDPGADGEPGAAGKDGVSPTVSTSEIDGGTRVTITDGTGEHTFDVMNGLDGGEAATPTIGDNGNWFINGQDTGKPSRGETGADGAPGDKGDPGPAGPAGPEGPTGPAGADGATGKNGENGAPGADGKDGVSPTVATSAIEGGTRVTITDASGAHAFDVLNGADGAKGADGANGKDGAKGPQGDPGPAGPVGPEGPKGPEGPAGADGATGPAGPDGFSPTVATAAIDNGTRVTITDASGAHTFDVLNGTGGGGGSTPETFEIPFSSLVFITGTAALELGNNGIDIAGVNLSHNPSEPATNTSPATVKLDNTTGAVTIDFDAVTDVGTGQPVPFGSLYQVEAGEYSTGQWSGALPIFADLSGGGADENTMRLNGMRIDGVSVYLDGTHRAEYSPVIVWEPLMDDPTKTMYFLRLAIHSLDPSATVKKGDRVHVNIRGHIAPALA